MLTLSVLWVGPWPGTLQDELTFVTLRMALDRLVPSAGLVHSDRGIRYDANDYTGAPGPSGHHQHEPATLSSAYLPPGSFDANLAAKSVLTVLVSQGNN